MLKDYSRAHTHIVSHRDQKPTPPYTFPRVPRPHAANIPTQPTARRQRSSAISITQHHHAIAPPSPPHAHHPRAHRPATARPRAPPRTTRGHIPHHQTRACAPPFATSRRDATARIIPDVPRAANLASHPRAIDPQRIPRGRDTAPRAHTTKKHA